MTKERPSQPASDPGLLDHHMVDELRALDAGSPSFWSGLVAEFLANSESELAAIAELLGDGDPEQAWRIAHGLKGACFMVGARQLGEVVMCVELAARDHDLAKALERLADVRRTYDATRRVLLALV